MKHLVIGAGATLAEAKALGNSEEKLPPLMGDFARKTWENYTPHPILERFLNDQGFTDLGDDPREKFYELEREKRTNIEIFMEYLWNNKHINSHDENKVLPPGYVSGFRLSIGGDSNGLIGCGEEFWQNFLGHGIGSPFQYMMIMCFHENGVGWKDFSLSKIIARSLSPGDLVLNLNYDTVFELALKQLGRSFSYAPNIAQTDEVVICKPHGSLNMVTNDKGFAFGQPDWLGMPQPPGYLSYSGLMPPRLNKKYTQNPISARMIQSVENRMPDDLIFWGVGVTNSDVDLICLYKNWSRKNPSVTVINPDICVARKIENTLNLPVQHFEDLVAWQAGRSEGINSTA